MRIAEPSGESNLLPYSTVRLQGCSDTTVGFTFLTEQPVVGKRRYCNKVLVHECLTINEPDPIDLTKVEFIATDDPCYLSFNIFKSSEQVDEIAPTIVIQTNELGEAIGVLVTFTNSELCCLPMRMAYRMYGYLDDYTTRILLSNGNLLVSPCNCSELTEDAPSGGVVWTGITW
jgi:hypothetical protein